MVEERRKTRRRLMAQARRREGEKEIRASLFFFEIEVASSRFSGCCKKKQDHY
jgi:hypothetical protein